VAHERLDDIADPVGKLGQDLLRFLSRRRPVHARLAALVVRAANVGNIGCYFKTVNQ
jgi:hypothetical protein